MRPSSWNGVGAIAKVPAALWVSFVIYASVLVTPSFRVRAGARPGMTVSSKPSRAHLDLFFGEENVLGMINDILRLPSRMRRLPALLFHHPHFAHPARAGDAQHLAGLLA